MPTHVGVVAGTAADGMAAVGTVAGAAVGVAGAAVAGVGAQRSVGDGVLVGVGAQAGEVRVAVGCLSERGVPATGG